VWREVRLDINYELPLLRRLLDEFDGEFKAALTAPTPPSVPKVAAIAGALHSFYNGIENILKRIAKTGDGGAPSGPDWHAELLRRMSQPTNVRPALLDPSLFATLDDYLGFRHVFRSHYSFELTWEFMTPLVKNARPTLDQLEQRLKEFLAAVDPSG
jgi:hypothetical protein